MNTRNLALMPVEKNNLMPTPMLGINTWTIYGVNINETNLKALADAMVANGMRDAGYVWFGIDSGWEATTRNADGVVEGNPTKFPNGLGNLISYLHSLGMKVGLHSSPDEMTDGNQLGSYGHYQEQSEYWASIGVDFLKNDPWHLSTHKSEEKELMQQMADILSKVDRPIAMNACEIDHSEWIWAPKFCYNVRIVDDNNYTWNSPANPGDEYPGGAYLDNYEYGLTLQKYNGPNSWMDLDMIKFSGDNLSKTEHESIFSTLCLLQTPICEAGNVANLSQDSLSIMLNRKALSIHQDIAAKPAIRVFSANNHDVVYKELFGGNYALFFFNKDNSSTWSCNTKDYNYLLPSSILTKMTDDVFGDSQSFSVVTGSTLSIPSHGCKLFICKDASL